MLAALAYALVVVMVRFLSRTETTASMVFWYLVMLSIGAGALAAEGPCRHLDILCHRHVGKDRMTLRHIGDADPDQVLQWRNALLTTLATPGE